MKKKCFIITFHAEQDLVLRSVQEINKKLNPNYICCVHSHNKTTPILEQIIQLSDSYLKLSNLGKQYPKHELHAQCICRNYSIGFSNVYKNVPEIEYIVALTGDTLVTNAMNFEHRYQEMKRNKTVARVATSGIVNFLSANSDPAKGKQIFYTQSTNRTNFFPQLFIVDGEFAQKTKVFSNIEVTNKFTSEECLGSELLKHIDKNNYSKYVAKLNTHTSRPYGYADGVKYHARTGGPGG